MRNGFAKGLNMKLIKDYANERGISHQAVYKLIETHKIELQQHIVKQGRTRFLTPKAEEILDSYRNKSQIVIEKAESNDEIEQLRQENRNLLLKITEQANKIAELSEWKADNSVLIAEANANIKLLEDKNARISDLEANNKQISDELSITKEELKKERNKSIFARIFGK